MKQHGADRSPPLLRDWGTPQPSALSEALGQRARRGAPLCDLITANPQEHGFEFPPELAKEILGEAADCARWYRPDARGQRTAREAVAAWHGQELSPRQVILTPGTSLAYFYAFRLLADPGDEVLVPSPTYPLFDDLARLAGLSVRRYHLHRDPAFPRHWRMDPEEIAFQITPRTRIVALVSPHNPTGTVATAPELAALADLARRHRLAIVSDEVFRTFLHPAGTPAPLRPSTCGAPLVITLNGLSKMLSLPGLKAGWMAVEGEDRPWCDQFLHGAEYLSDTFLPVSELAQAALPRLMREGESAASLFARLCAERMEELVNTWRGAGVALPLPEGSPYLTVDLPDTFSFDSEEKLVLRLVAQHGILVHPGALYSMPRPCLVMTCVRGGPWPVKAILEETALLT